MHLKIPKLVKADQSKVEQTWFSGSMKIPLCSGFSIFQRGVKRSTGCHCAEGTQPLYQEFPPTLFENKLGYSIIFLINPFPDKSLLLFRQIGIRDACSTVDIFNCCSYLLLSISFVFVCFIRFICFYLLYLFLSASICFTCFKTVLSVCFLPVSICFLSVFNLVYLFFYVIFLSFYLFYLFISVSDCFSCFISFYLFYHHRMLQMVF